MVRKLFRFLFRAIWKVTSLTMFAASIVLLCAVLVVEGPQIYANYLRDVARSSVVLISVKRGENSGAQGTGFHVTTPKGKKLLVTNRHVCADAVNGVVQVADEREQQFVEKKIIRVSKTTDLCAIEPLDDAAPLELAPDLLVGEKVVTAGHPSGLPLTIDYGQVIGTIATSTDEEISEEEIAAGKCKYKNDKIVDVTEDGRTYKACREYNRAIMTTAQVVGGSSGSPLLNRYGLVVGIVFLKHVNDYAGAIPLKQLRRFLADE